MNIEHSYILTYLVYLEKEKSSMNSFYLNKVDGKITSIIFFVYVCQSQK